MEEKAYYTLDEAATLIGVQRATLYNYLKDLKIQTRRFGRDRKAYLSLEEVKRIGEYKENPWKFGAAVEHGALLKTQDN